MQKTATYARLISNGKIQFRANLKTDLETMTRQFRAYFHV